MKKATTTLLLLTALAAPAAWAQSAATPNHNMATASSMTGGEIRKIDKDAGKVTIKHGDIKHLDMPGMTMVFTVRDKTMLTPFKAGDRVQFMVIDDKGKMLITDLQPAP